MISKRTETMRAERIQRWMTRLNHQLVAGVVTPSGRNIWVNGNVVDDDRLPDCEHGVGLILMSNYGPNLRSNLIL